MDVIGMLSHATDALVDMVLGCGPREAKLSRLDYGMLEVALMVAALDGVILKDETDAFVRLVRACPGCADKEFDAVLDRALRRAGYLAAMAQTGLLSDEKRIDAFVTEAEKAMPHGFVDGTRADVRRAFVMWIMMAMSDGAYSGIERRSIAALAEHFADEKFTRATAAALSWASAYPQANMPTQTVVATPLPLNAVKLVEDDFFAQVEALVGKFGDAAQAESAHAALQALVNMHG